jgi:PEGA domain
MPRLAAQSGAVIPQGGAGHAAQASCLILKRMGPADQVTSRMYSFGIRGKQFQYIEGKLPEGFPFHGRLTDHDVRNLQGRGAEVIVLEPHYVAEDLMQARADCKGETGKTPNQASEPASLLQPETGGAKPSAGSASPPARAPTSGTASPQVLVGRLLVSSTPDGADIEVDGSFVGNTPSDVQAPEGNHNVSIKKVGFKDWERTVKVTAGNNIHLNAALEKAASQ